jgi:Domain of unknown function (DUF4276)
VTKFQVFFEGHTSLKLPLLSFITKACPSARGRVTIRLGKNKAETIKDFLRALGEGPVSTLVLLVDSDAPDHGSLLQNVMKTSLWREHTPKKLSTPAVHWMVQVMESWFVADERALRSYYGRKFKPKALPKPKNVEAIAASQVFKALDGVSGGKYDKASHAPKILDRLDPQKVRSRASNCDRFLKFVAAQLE